MQWPCVGGMSYFCRCEFWRREGNTSPGGGSLERNCDRINIREYSISRYEVRQPIFPYFRPKTSRFWGCRGHTSMVRHVTMCYGMACTMASHEIPHMVAIEGRVRHWYDKVRHKVLCKVGHKVRHKVRHRVHYTVRQKVQHRVSRGAQGVPKGTQGVPRGAQGVSM